MDKNKALFPVGGSLFCSGSDTTSLVKERAVTGLIRRQDNIAGHLENTLQELQQQKEQQKIRTPGIQAHERHKDTNLNLLITGDNLSGESNQEIIKQLSLMPALANLEKELLASKVFVSGNCLNGIRQQFAYAHHSGLYLHLSLQSEGDAKRLGELAGSFINGTEAVNGKALLGNLIVTAPHLGSELGCFSSESHPWLSQLLWLIHPALDLV
jgi:hypothetical protein